MTDLKKYFFSLKKSVLCVHLAVFRWYIRLSGGQGVDTFSVFGGRLVHILKQPRLRAILIFQKF